MMCCNTPQYAAVIVTLLLGHPLIFSAVDAQCAASGLTCSLVDKTKLGILTNSQLCGAKAFLNTTTYCCADPLLNNTKMDCINGVWVCPGTAPIAYK